MYLTSPSKPRNKLKMLPPSVSKAFDAETTNIRLNIAPKPNIMTITTTRKTLTLTIECEKVFPASPAQFSVDCEEAPMWDMIGMLWVNLRPYRATIKGSCRGDVP